MSDRYCKLLELLLVFVRPTLIHLADTYEAVLFLEGKDTDIALATQDLIRVYGFSYILLGIANAVWQLLEVTGHAVTGTVMKILWGATNVVVLGCLLLAPENVSLASSVAWVYNATAVVFIGATVVWAWNRLQPFVLGLLGS